MLIGSLPAIIRTFLAGQTDLTSGALTERSGRFEACAPAGEHVARARGVTRVSPYNYTLSLPIRLEECRRGRGRGFFSLIC